MAATDYLTPQEVQRLAKLLRMLSADAVGERAAAALMVHRFVTERELDWADILDPPEPPPNILSVGVGNRPPAASAFDPGAFVNTPVTPSGPSMAAGWQPSYSTTSYAGQNRPRPQASPPPPRPPPPIFIPTANGHCPTWQDAVACMDMFHMASPRLKIAERTFIADLKQRQLRLSDKQEIWLRDICNRHGLTFPTSMSAAAAQGWGPAPLNI